MFEKILVIDDDVLLKRVRRALNKECSNFSSRP